MYGIVQNSHCLRIAASYKYGLIDNCEMLRMTFVPAAMLLLQRDVLSRSDGNSVD